VFVADGIKIPKEGRKVPAVKKLFQQSENNSKPTFIFGHSFEALGLLVHGPLGHIACVPLLSRIQGERRAVRCETQMFSPPTIRWTSAVPPGSILPFTPCHWAAPSFGHSCARLWREHRRPAQESR